MRFVIVIMSEFKLFPVVVGCDVDIALSISSHKHGQLAGCERPHVSGVIRIASRMLPLNNPLGLPINGGLDVRVCHHMHIRQHRVVFECGKFELYDILTGYHTAIAARFLDERLCM